MTMECTQSQVSLALLLNSLKPLKMILLIFGAAFYVSPVVAKSTTVVDIALSKSRNIEMAPPVWTSLTIPFTWRYLPSEPDLPRSAIGSQWRHQYEINLLSKGESLEILDEIGKRTEFIRIKDNLFESDTPAMGRIIREDQYSQWITDKKQIVFYGSYPVTIKHPHSSAIKLRYKDSKLTRVFDQAGNSIHLIYNENNTIAKLIQPNGEAIHFDYDQHYRLASSSATGVRHNYTYTSAPPVVICLPSYSQADTEADDGLCSDTEVKPSDAYEFAASDAVYSKIDLRPSSCKSYFVEYNSIERGVKIESGLFMHSLYSHLTPTVRSFPVVDFIDGREVIAVYSKDLNSKSYSSLTNPDGLFKSIMLDADKADTLFLSKLNSEGMVTAKEKGQTTTIYKDQVDGFRMELIIQAGMATPDHLIQIEKARQALWQDYNIRLQVIQIP